MACVAVISLMRTLELEFLQSNPRLIFHDRQHIISLHEKLGFLQTFLEESEKKAENHEELKEVTAKIREVASKAEYDIEAELVKIHEHHQTLRRVLEDVEQLMDMTKNAHHLAKHLQIDEHLESSSSPGGRQSQSSSQQTSEFEKGDTMVGHAEEFEELKDQLLRSSSSETRQVMALVGMGGIGKTTFARSIYDDSVVKSHFDCCGWATTSQDHNKRQVLLQLCRSVMPMRDDINTQNDGELAEQLYRSLLGRRYLIILDDIWTTEAWDDVQRCFPSESMSSRILLTTRLKEVADYACSAGKLSYDMRFLYPDESWNLFYQKFLVKDFFMNKEFEAIGRNIVRKCQGFPLTVVVLAGLLATNMAVDEWKNVESELNSLVNLDLSQQFSRILSLSYNNLPTHLKGCFLYLGAFPEDSNIEIKKAIRLWIAEGFVKEVSPCQMTLEELGEDYLKDLIDRSLIMISGRSTDGKIKTCRMHDLLHDLCANKAKKEKLLCTEDNGNDGHIVHSDDNRWLSLKVVSPRFHLRVALNKSRSILCFDMYAFHDHDWYLQANSFKMLRVLDLTVIDYKGSIPSDIIDMVLLRYLALASNRLLTSIPVWKNRNLQTLIVCEDINGGRELPNGVWDLPQLRHLEVYHQLSIYTPKVVRVNLQTIYWLRSFQCTKQVFLRIPNVKELGIIAQGGRSHRCLDNLSCLNHLEKVNIQGSYCPIKLPGANFPQNLKNITFSRTLMPWEAMDIVSMLPNLEVLKLKNHACLGQEWELTEQDGFRRLKLLLISVTDLKDWKTDDVDYPFPGLERLVLRNCFELKEMPSWIEDLSNLKSIQLEHCYASLVSSAKMIEQEIHENYGEGYGFQILDFHTTQSAEELNENGEDQNNREKSNDAKEIDKVFEEHMYVEELIRGIVRVVQSIRLEARSLSITWVDDPRYWSWTWDSGYEVAELLKVWWLDIRGTVDTGCLHKMTCYSAYLVYKIKPGHYGIDQARSSVRYVNDNNSNSEKQVFFAGMRSSANRNDEWLEIKLGEFNVKDENEGVIEMRLWNTQNWKSGLVVRAIEVRPN